MDKREAEAFGNRKTTLEAVESDKSGQGPCLVCSLQHQYSKTSFLKFSSLEDAAFQSDCRQRNLGTKN